MPKCWYASFKIEGSLNIGCKSDAKSTAPDLSYSAKSTAPDLSYSVFAFHTICYLLILYYLPYYLLFV